MFGLARGGAQTRGCGDLRLRFAVEIPDMVRGGHRARIEDVRRSHPHTIVYCDEQPGDGVCLPYALGLLGQAAYEDITISTVGLAGSFVGTDFANWLINGRLTEIGRPREGALVFYFKDDLWAHAGKVVQRGRVRSKWGQFPVYEHEIWEVPCRYGDAVRFFEMPPLDIFQEYASSQGIAGWHLPDWLDSPTLAP